MQRIDNLYDWCISRQIWWGHRIPIWYCDDCGQYFFSTDKPDSCLQCSSKNLRQDADTLDTWFSSGAWTFSTLGWPAETDDLLKYHPTDWMQMGYEIIFLWMARMILLSTYALDDIPFKDVYIHGILRAKDGRKFSKSLGNGLDPLEVIATYGTDALRLGLVRGVTAGNDSRFYLEKVEGSRNFINKLWNISRFILQGAADPRLVEAAPDAKTLADKWILGKLQAAVKGASEELDKYDFSGAIEILYEFTWSDFADWYLEIAKIEGSKDDILLNILQTLLKIWHPFCPFITENIWSYLNAKDLLIVAKWPSAESSAEANSVVIKDFGLIKDIITAVRNLRSENKVEPAKQVTVKINAADKYELVKAQEEIIKRLARIEKLEYIAAAAKPAGCVGAVVGKIDIYLNLEGLVDVAAETKRLEKEIQETETYAKGLYDKLTNNEFASHAPEAIVMKEKEKYEAVREKLVKLQEQFARLK